jgi:thioesterase domain-containing protein
LATLDGYPATNRDHIAFESSPDELGFIQEMKEKLKDRLTTLEIERIIRSLLRTPSLAAQFRPSVFGGDMMVFTAAENRESPALWTPYVSGEIVVHDLQCKHADISHPKNMQLIARMIENRLV